MPDRPNILLIHVDQWRGDCLSIEGHPVVHTPYLDQLALEGARFRRAYSATPVCIPARAALMTGLSQRSHRRVAYQDGIPWDYETTMAGEFSKGGYRTHCIGKLHAYPERNRLGFESVELHDGFLHFARDRRRGDLAEIDDYTTWLRKETRRADADYFEHGLNCNSVVARPWDKEERLHPTNWVVTRALDFLARRLDAQRGGEGRGAMDAGRPFVLFVSFHRPHPPYDPPAWAFGQYLHADMPEPPAGNWVEDFAEHDRTPSPVAFRARYRPEVLRRARAGYYGHMTHIDHQVNRLIEGLHEYRLRDDTWICFTSDHGEMIGDHFLFRKGFGYEGSARVPLLLRGPRGSGVRPGTTSDAVVEQRDIMPTLLECAGLPVPECVEGKSFLQQARGATGGVRPWLHGELTMLGESFQWLTDGREKYLWFSREGREQLFDLADDPQECRDLVRTGGDAVASRLEVWRERLATELAGREEGYVRDGRLQPGREPRSLLTRGG
ncbi:MAG: arylsulfatase [Opitutaceae bacterium]|jgi:arylsulfatase A-like enzyme|nr:arylsulfatase [Opitutaceae bacterium]